MVIVSPVVIDYEFNFFATHMIARRHHCRVAGSQVPTNVARFKHGFQQKKKVQNTGFCVGISVDDVLLFMTFRYFANFGSLFVQLVRPVRARAFYFLEVIIHFCDFPKTLTPRLAFLYTDIMETLCQRELFLLYLAYNMERVPECLLRHQTENNTKLHILK